MNRRARDGPRRLLAPLLLLAEQHQHRDCGQDDHDDVTDHLEDEGNREEADPVHYLAEQDAGEDERDEVDEYEKAVATSPASAQNSRHVEKAEFSTTTMQTSLSAKLVPDELQVCETS